MDTNKMLSAFNAKIIASEKNTSHNKEDLMSFLEAVKAEAEAGKFEINLAFHHMDIVPILISLGYVITPTIDDIGYKFIVSWH